MPKSQGRFSDTINIHCPHELKPIVSMAAENSMETISAYARAALVTRLRNDGFLPRIIVNPDGKIEL